MCDIAGRWTLVIEECFGPQKDFSHVERLLLPPSRDFKWMLVRYDKTPSLNIRTKKIQIRCGKNANQFWAESGNNRVDTHEPSTLFNRVITHCDSAF